MWAGHGPAAGSAQFQQNNIVMQFRQSYYYANDMQRSSVR